MQQTGQETETVPSQPAPADCGGGGKLQAPESASQAVRGQRNSSRAMPGTSPRSRHGYASPARTLGRRSRRRHGETTTSTCGLSSMSTPVKKLIVAWLAHRVVNLVRILYATFPETLESRQHPLLRVSADSLPQWVRRRWQWAAALPCARASSRPVGLGHEVRSSPGD